MKISKFPLEIGKSREMIIFLMKGKLFEGEVIKSALQYYHVRNSVPLTRARAGLPGLVQNATLIDRFRVDNGASRSEVFPRGGLLRFVADAFVHQLTCCYIW